LSRGERRESLYLLAVISKGREPAGGKRDRKKKGGGKVRDRRSIELRLGMKIGLEY